MIKLDLHERNMSWSIIRLCYNIFLSFGSRVLISGFMDMIEGPFKILPKDTFFPNPIFCLYIAACSSMAEGTCIRKVLEVTLEKFPGLPGPPPPPKFLTLENYSGASQTPNTPNNCIFSSKFHPHSGHASRWCARSVHTTLSSYVPP